MWLLVTLIAVPIAFCAISWAFVTVSRIWTLEDLRAIERRTQRVRTAHRSAPLYARESGSGFVLDAAEDLWSTDAYCLAGHESSGIPLTWHTDLWMRRN